MEAKLRRMQHLQDARRQLVLAAARRVIGRLGLEGASIREIARECGYTPGALYAYFDAKHALLLALLEESLMQLTEASGLAKAARGPAGAQLLAKGDAWLNWLIQHPQDLQLILYFLAVSGDRQLDRETGVQVHGAIRATLHPLGNVLAGLGLSPDQVEAELESVLAHAAGLLMAQDATRLQPQRLAPQVLFAAYLQRMLQALTGGDALPVSVDGPETSAQVDLFG